MKIMHMFSASGVLMRSLVAILSCALLLAGGPAWAGLQPPLGKLPVPEPANLTDFVKNKIAAIALGKALFWDMQVGSDGQTACATCHFKAGADIRLINTVNPGADGLFSMNTSSVPMGPAYTLNTASTTTFYDFPLFQISPTSGRVGIDTVIVPPDLVPAATVTRNIDDIVGSQGVIKTDFVSITTGTAVETGATVSDPTFTFNGQNLRQVTNRNAPSVINSVFNYTNYWDGRANNIFNGANPFGPASEIARTQIWINNAGTLENPPQQLAIPNAALASLASGHALNETVISYKNRTFPELGRKMLSLTPLGLQLVSRNDSVFSDVNGQDFTRDIPGLNTNYQAMIEAAFQDNLWENNAQTVSINTVSGPQPFSQIESNFSLFFGLSVQLYLATLVSDRAPFDRFQMGNQNALNSAAQRGLLDFDARCALCHAGSEFTSAVVGNTVLNDVPLSFTSNANHRLIQARLTNPITDALPAAITFDTGFYNTAVRATAEDAGRGGVAPIVNTLPEPDANVPLSFTRLAILQFIGQLPFTTPELPAIIPPDRQDALQGAFKVPGLRNVELTPPYMHNGGMFTLEEVIQFYTRGGNFPDVNQPELAIAPIRNLRGDPAGQGQLVEFLKSLTDDRVRSEEAPFDHPQLFIPNGGDTIELLATGGITTVTPTLTFNALISPTILPTLATSGTVTDDSTLTDKVIVEVTINNLAPAAALVTGTTWTHTVTGLTTIGTNTITVTATHWTGGVSTATQSILRLPAATITGAPVVATNKSGATLTIGGEGVATYQFKLDDGVFSADTPTTTNIVLNGLSEGLHTVAVLGKDVSGAFQQPLATPTAASWTVKTIPPVLTLDPVSSISRSAMTIKGTVELGLVPKVQADTATSVGPISVIGGNGIATWSCAISGLAKGLRTITISATDIATNVTTTSADVKIIYPDGDFRETGETSIFDALKALHIAVGLSAASPEDMLHGDVAPLVAGVPAPDDKVDVNDALTILKKVAGLVSF